MIHDANQRLPVAHIEQQYKFETIRNLADVSIIIGNEILSRTEQTDWLNHDLMTLHHIEDISEGLNGLICVNISSETINTISDEMMYRASIGSPGMVIEWVETLCSPAVITEAAARLRTWRQQFGIRISIDDMGKGQDGVERFLLTIPDFAKIEGSLLHGARESNSYRRAMKFLCHWCMEENVPTVVEWIETAKDLEIAIDCGAKYGQGYLFDKKRND